MNEIVGRSPFGPPVLHECEPERSNQRVRVTSFGLGIALNWGRRLSGAWALADLIAKLGRKTTKSGAKEPPTLQKKHENNFDIIRLILATLVYIGHYSWIFPDSSVPKHILAVLIGSDGQRCVQAFFVISGYLMYISLDRSDNILYFFERRFRRIYPGYFTVICLSALFGACFSTLSLRNYISYDVLRYIVWNLTFLNFLHPTLPGVFDNQSVHVVNGPLWTLKIEVSYYLLFPFMFFAGRKIGFMNLSVLLYSLSTIYHTWMVGIANQSGLHSYEVLSTQLPGQLAYFAAGSAFASWGRDHTKNMMALIPLVAICTIVSLWYCGLPFFLPVIIAVFVLYLSFLGPRIGKWARHGDLSYGIYIIHFPILQALRSSNVLDKHPDILFIFATISIYFLAFGMWHLVEGPCLKGRWTSKILSPAVS